ncbi:hypothetical protein [Bradyrhizobium neotropicale]|uniref:hypothetical protein n=1 Tax=Bradyrhizobium neotropicale TaxID=1497615 RepID=UPI001AD75E76|nr:hypothetical protein [Bradyrhizobium neotropicale]MBO4228164.1 hypothetical protein [Bradyrhizobium neotropicale]
MGTNEFSVCQVFTSGDYEYVRRFVSADEAVKAALHCSSSIAAKIGIVDSIMITDGLDCIVFEWRRNQGIVVPESVP